MRVIKIFLTTAFVAMALCFAVRAQEAGGEPPSGQPKAADKPAAGDKGAGLIVDFTPAAPKVGTKAWTGEDDDEGDPNAYFGGLSARAHATLYDAYRATYILLTGDQDYVRFTKLRGYLVRKSVLSRGWLHREASERVIMGDVAMLLANSIGIKGGVFMRLTRFLGLMSRRYTFRELSFLGIVPAENAQEYVGGAELTTILYNASDYKERLDARRSGAEKTSTELFEEEADSAFQGDGEEGK